MAMFSPSTRDTTHAWENGVAQVNPPQAPSQTPFRDFSGMVALSADCAQWDCVVRLTNM